MALGTAVREQPPGDAGRIWMSELRVDSWFQLVRSVSHVSLTAELGDMRRPPGSPQHARSGNLREAADGAHRALAGRNRVVPFTQC